MNKVKNPGKDVFDEDFYQKMKFELKNLKHRLTRHIENIENGPQEIENMKKWLSQRKELFRKEEETPGYLIQIKNTMLENVKQEIKENPEEDKDVNMVLVKQYIETQYNLENLKVEIDFLETEIRVEIKSQENSKNMKIFLSSKIEELENVVGKGSKK